VAVKATCGQRLPPVVWNEAGNAFQRHVEEFPIAHRSEFAVERRKGIRYRMNASVLFRWSGPEDEHCQGQGTTRDMSVSGAYIVTATCPPPNAVVRMEVFLPLSDGGSKALMQADMMVLRVEHEIEGNSRSGFSAVGKGFSLRTFSGQGSRIVNGTVREAEDSTEGEE
jgi:hypothetical protein